MASEQMLRAIVQLQGRQINDQDVQIYLHLEPTNPTDHTPCTNNLMLYTPSARAVCNKKHLTSSSSSSFIRSLTQDMTFKDHY